MFRFRNRTQHIVIDSGEPQLTIKSQKNGIDDHLKINVFALFRILSQNLQEPDSFLTDLMRACHEFPCSGLLHSAPPMFSLAPPNTARHHTRIKKGFHMSDAVRIFTHAFSMVFRDFAATVRATSVGIILIAAAAAMLIVVAPGLASGAVGFDDPDSLSELSNFGLIIPAFLLMGIGYLMMVAAWHRYVLLPADRREEGFTPSADIVLGYLGRSILLGLAIGLIAIPVFIPIGIVGATAGEMMAGLVAIPLIAFLGWLFFRWSLILPACTIGRKMRFRESWDATKPLATTILGIMIMVAVLDFGLNFVLAALISDNAISAIISVTVSVLYALVSASILTTLYGIAVEGRQI